MKKIELFNTGWTFRKKDEKQIVDLPHTWNALDGQGAAPTYYRGVCTYTKIISKYPGQQMRRFD